MDLTDKLEFLADTAKYDASCASGGAPKRSDRLGRCQRIAGSINAAVAAASGQPLLVQGFAEWREAARELLAFDIAPHAVKWMAHDGGGDLFSSALPVPAATIDPHRANPTLHLPRKLMDMLQSAACCRVDDRWAFLYRVVWRWQHGEQAVLSAADEDGSRLHAMVKAVHREEHDMHAYIRFRERPEADGAPRFVAWFEPAHDVLPQVAQHFVSRMGRISWMIATPDASVLWDGATLHNTGPLMRSAADLDDAGEALWLTYYRSIFNPARPHARPLQSHVLPRFWKNLPGAPFVGPAGRLLDRVLGEAGLERRAAYLTNAVKHFKWEPRGKRRLRKTPAQREIEACSFWLDQELAQVQPDVIVVLGSTALCWARAMSRSRTRWPRRPGRWR